MKKNVFHKVQGFANLHAESVKKKTQFFHRLMGTLTCSMSAAVVRVSENRLLFF